MSGTSLVPLSQLLAAVAQPAALVSASGGFDWCNPLLLALFPADAPPESLADWESRSPPGGEGDELWAELARTGSALRRLATNGGVGVFRFAFVRGRDGDGVLLCRSAAEHREVRELRDRTASLEAVFHSLNEGVLALDAESRITAFSLSAERITGFAEDEVLGRVCRDVFQAPAGAECPFEAVARDGGGFRQREMEIRGKGGRPIHVAVNATVLRDEGGTVGGAVIVLRDLVELDRLRRELGGPPEAHGIIGQHPTIRRVVEKLETVAPSDASILILGESGTGKELVARALHELSPRRGGAFVKVNCGALSESLLESELFGHVRGAFTGAVRDRTGRFEAADGGTLFLDEVGDTSPALQVKLLRVLQEGEFERLGETRTLRADVRVVAATNKDLRAEVAAGRFREDLFYRLCVVPIQLPPLRDRRDDVPFLAEHFLRRLVLKEGRRKTLSGAVYGVLEAHPWPGNVRELENAVAHAYVCTPGDVIYPEALPEHLLRPEALQRGTQAPDSDSDAEDVYAALVASGWNKGEAARRLAVSRTTLWRRMKDLGIHDRSRPRSTP